MDLVDTFVHKTVAAGTEDLIVVFAVPRARFLRNIKINPTIDMGTNTPYDFREVEMKIVYNGELKAGVLTGDTEMNVKVFPANTDKLISADMINILPHKGLRTDETLCIYVNNASALTANIMIRIRGTLVTHI